MVRQLVKWQSQGGNSAFPLQYSALLVGLEYADAWGEMTVKVTLT